MTDTAMLLWLLTLSVLLLFSTKDLADMFQNLKGGGGNPPNHPLPATGSIEKSRKRRKKSNQPT